MRTAMLAGLFWIAAAGGAFPQGGAVPANTLRELFAQLDQCLVAPGGVPGSQITIVFSLKRDGSPFAKPRISFSRLTGSEAEQRAFGEGVAAAFDKCLPAAITDALGGAIAGRPISMRFMVRERKRNPDAAWWYRHPGSNGGPLDPQSSALTS